jgi:hypothetical protein
MVLKDQNDMYAHRFRSFAFGRGEGDNEHQIPLQRQYASLRRQIVLARTLT